MQLTSISFDPSALAWITGEVEGSLASAHEDLHQVHQRSSSVDYSPDDVVDKEILHAAAEQIHKAAGALELAACSEAAKALHASEILLKRWIHKPSHMTLEGINAVEALSFAVIDLIRQTSVGKVVFPVALFPQYQAVMKHSGVELPRPSDLWRPPTGFSLDWPIFEAPNAVEPVQASDLAVQAFEAGLLSMLTGELEQAKSLSALLEGMSFSANQRLAYRDANAWLLGSAFLQGLASQRIPFNLHTKRLLSQLFSQVRASIHHNQPSSERLAHDLIFFCAQASPLVEASIHLESDNGLLDQVRQELAVNNLPRIDLDSLTLGLYDPAVLALALKRVSSVKDAWSSLIAGNTSNVKEINDLFVDFNDSLRSLYTHGDVLAQALTNVVADVVQAGKAPVSAVAMEVATTLLYVEASWQDQSTFESQQPDRLQRLADRIDRVLNGQEPEPLDSWVESIFMRVTDAQTMSEVVQELQIKLSKCESSIEQLLRDPSQGELVQQVSVDLTAVKSIFAFLEFPQAILALDIMNTDINSLSDQSDTVETDLIQDRLVSNLSALGFLVNLLNIQPVAARDLFAFDEATGLLTRQTNKITTDIPSVLDINIEQPDLHEEGLSFAPPPSQEPGLNQPQDHEMEEVFTEEANEILLEAQHAASILLKDPNDIIVFITLRRAFHTLKGSAKMVDLRDYGECAWACEQLYNTWIANQFPANDELQTFTQEALAYLSNGVGIIESSGTLQNWDPSSIIETAHALRQKGFQETPAQTPIQTQNTQEQIEQVIHEPNQETLPSEIIIAEVPVENVQSHEASFPLNNVSANDEMSDEQYKFIGHLRVAIPLFTIFLNEADEQSRRLCQLLSEWALEYQRPLSDEPVNIVHSMAGNSSAVGFSDLAVLSRSLEEALLKAQALGSGNLYAASLFVDAADEVRRLLHQFAAGFLKSPSPEIIQALYAYAQKPQEVTSAVFAEPVKTSEPDPESSKPLLPEVASPFNLGDVAIKAFVPIDQSPEFLSAHTYRPNIDLGQDTDIDAVDVVDSDLFPTFQEEASESLPQLKLEMNQWFADPNQRNAMNACMRSLHNLKGSARLVGAMRLGELAHRIETDLERLAAQNDIAQPDIEPLLNRVDVLQEMFDNLETQQNMRESGAGSFNSLRSDTGQITPNLQHTDQLPPAVQGVEGNVFDLTQPNVKAYFTKESNVRLNSIDWSMIKQGAFRSTVIKGVTEAQAAPSFSAIRVKSKLLDSMLNQVGEVGISRTKLAEQVQLMRSAMGDLTENTERLRLWLNEIELQAKNQLGADAQESHLTQQEFDPLEFDRYTRFQEVTRMMAESVNDVATVQSGLLNNLQLAENQLVEQSNMNRALQDDLLRTRMVEFNELSDRLYRVMRQASKETGKQVRFDVVGGQTNIDRGLLDRMTVALEHLLRNCVTHGIELPEVRIAKGKPPVGSVLITVKQDGNEVSIECRDDGAGLDMQGIFDKAMAGGLLAAGQQATESELTQLIFSPGFTTAEHITELAGRGIGMDVVRNTLISLGGRIETATAKGQGTSFNLIVPLTTAVTNIILVRCGNLKIAIPSDLIELIRRLPKEEVELGYQAGNLLVNGHPEPLFSMQSLLGLGQPSPKHERLTTVLTVRSVQQRLVLHVDEIIGNEVVVVKNLGPQLSRVPGLVGMTMLASSDIVLIYNPVALATLYGHLKESLGHRADAAFIEGASQTSPTVAPLVMVVDDSITVRRVTQRLLNREGYRVVLARDGLDAMDKMIVEVPALLLSDIEMPRMNGFDLLHNLRANSEWKHLPIVMITSRIAQKHRDYAINLGADGYLGKPFNEGELLKLVAHYASKADLTTA